MATTYLWQYNLRLVEKEISTNLEINPKVQKFIDSGSIENLLYDLSCAKQDLNILTKIILNYLNIIDPKIRPDVARYIYHLTWNKGLVRQAADMALRYVC